MPIERRYLTLTEVVTEFPVLDGWFDDPENPSAQIQEAKKLMSVREKLQLLGGEDLVRETLSQVEGRGRNRHLVLMACRQEPMVSYEIDKFGEKVGLRIVRTSGIGGMFNIIKPLVHEGALATVPGITHITRHGDRFDIGNVRSGYLTTEQGLRIMSQNLQHPQSRSFSGLYLPDSASP